MSVTNEKSEAQLMKDLQGMADSSAEAEALLGSMAAALFPSGRWDLSHLTWPEAGGTKIATDDQGGAESRLRAAELRYRTLVEQIPAVTFMAVLGEGRNEIYVSPHIEAMLGFSQTEWLENPFLWYNRLHPDDRPLWNEEFAKGCRTGGPFRADCRFLARNGRVVWVHGEARLVRDDLGRPLFLQGIAFDITDIKESQERKIRTEKLAAIGQLAASVGHDLRNPLAAIRNAYTYVSRKVRGTEVAAGDPRVPQFLELMDRELNAASKIIADLLDFARDRAPALESCPLKPLVAEALSIVTAPATVKVVETISESLPVPRLDKDQFRQVIVNLVQNAVEAIGEGPGTVRVEASIAGADLLFSVSDDGPGIPADVLARIFEPLFTTKRKGTGLGLAIVESIVRRHGGSIDAESTVGKGTTFRARIPMPPPG